VDTIGGRIRLRLIPALLTAIGVSLLAAGLMSYTTAVQPPPSSRPLATYEPLPTLAGPIILPGASAEPTVEPTFPADRVATRIVIRRLDIDLPIVLQSDYNPDYPVCDVAMYLVHDRLGQPGQSRSTYLYAHARAGMFLPLLLQSQRNNGERMLGMTVEVYTSDSWRYVYTITEVRRHTETLTDALNATVEQLWMQTSEGPEGTIPKLQVVADFLSAAPTDFKSAHPKPKVVICS
jgi:hypothetical protein